MAIAEPGRRLKLLIMKIEIIAAISAVTLVIAIISLIKLTKMANEVDDLTTEVAETKGIMKSAKTLIEGFAAALAAAGTDPAKLAALRSDLSSGSDELAAAISANPLPGEVVTPV